MTVATAAIAEAAAKAAIERKSRVGDVRHRGRFALAALWVVVLTAITTTAQPILPDIGIDSSWQLAIYTAFQRHLDFGTNVIWTYGPYGWLNYPFFFDLPLSRLAVLANVGANIALLCLLAAHLWVRRVGLIQWLIVGAILGGIVDWSTYVSFDSSITYASMLLLVFALTSDRPRSQLWCAVGGGALLGLASLVRGTDLIIGVVLLAIATAYGFGFRRPWPALPAIAAAVTFVLLWIVSLEAIGSIPAYLRGVYEVSSGYSAAMSRLYESSLVLPFAVIILLLLGTGVTLAFALRDRETGLILLFCLPIGFVSFKEGFVRHSYLSFFYTILVLLCLAAPEILSERPRHHLATPTIRPTWWLVAGLCVGVLITTIPTPFLLLPRAPIVRVYAQAATSVYSASFRDRQQSDIVRTIQQHYHLSAGLIATLRNGDVDVMPWDTDLIYGYQLNWNPRPVLQSYVAYTSYLDQADANHFSSSKGPRYVVYYFYDYEHSLDSRYTAFDEPSAFRALLEHYVPVDTSGPLLLQRRSVSVPDGATPMGRTCASLGEWISVPASVPGRFVYSNLEIPYSVSGVLLDVLYKPAELRITFRYGADSMSPAFRLIPRVAGDGFLVAGYAGNADEFAHLFEGLVDNPITAFQVTAPNGPQDYASGVCSQFVSREAPPPAG
jgi:hypothetical protein